MSSKTFHERRRQQFLNEELYEKTRINLHGLIKLEVTNSTVYQSGTKSHSVTYEMLYLEALWAWMLDYTAGISIEELAPRIAGIVGAFETWNEVHQVYRQALAIEFPAFGKYRYIAAPDFSTLADYEDTLQLLSIAIMLRDERSVERIIHVLRSHRGEDGLFEELISPYVDDYQSIETCILGEPFETLLKAFNVESAGETLDLIKEYLKRWYPKMKNHPRWYDGHLRVSPDGYAPYYGYWAFEAGATVYLLGLNDHSIDHMVYPKDLVAYGNMLRDQGRCTSKGSDAADETGRVEGGQPCPEAGYWFTPAKADSRRYFKEGEVMPVFDGSQYGATIWQWSPQQSDD